MQKTIDLAGNAAGILGIVVCLLAGIVRLTGSYNLMEIPVGLAFESGVGLMVFACLAKLHLLPKTD